jgi:PmbA protein
MRELAEQVLAQIKQQGMDSGEVTLSRSQGLSTTVRLGAVETVSYKKDRTMQVTVYHQQRTGSAMTTDFRSDRIQHCVETACRIAEYSEADPCSGLADPDRMATSILDLKLHYPWTLSVEAAVEWASRCEAAARAVDRRIVNSEGATLSTQQEEFIYANTHGFIGGYPSSQYVLNCSVIGQMNESMQGGYDFTRTRNAEQLASPEWVGQQAANKALRRLGACKLSTCDAPVLFSREVAGSLWGHLISAISGSSLYRRASFLVDHLEKSLFPSWVSIVEQPHLIGGLGSAPFDQEGVATCERILVASGILKRYILNSYTARQLGLSTTGNAGGVHNLHITPNAGDQTALLKMMDRGLWVTDFMGQGVNMVTGDYSRGVSGFWVENGEIQFPVEEITIAGNLRDMFQNIIAIGNDTEHRSHILTGSILLDTMTIAGQ